MVLKMKGMPMWAVIAISLLGGVCGGYAAVGMQSREGKSGATRVDNEIIRRAAVPAGARAANAGALPYFVDAAAKASPAVVHVRVVGVVERESPYRGTLLEFFFGAQPNVQQQVQLSGSGALISPDGYIVTNFHVVKNARAIEVSLPDKRNFEAKTVASDPATDLALLKVQSPRPLPYIEFGKSDSLRVGEWVLAIGNPFNLETTVTAGIVSATARNINTQSGKVSIESLIQVDAAVNMGNSGGPLVDLDGRLVGINTAIASPTGAFAGYAFSIPESIVTKFVEDVRRYGEVRHVVLGVNIMNMNSQLAEEFANGDTRGVIVGGVYANGPADRAGIRVYDIILSVNGRRVNTVTELQGEISRLTPGDTADVVVFRSGREERVRVQF